MITTRTSNKLATSTLVVVGTAYLIFIVLGIPDGMLGVAWPSMRATYGVALGQMGVLLLASTAGFLLTSFSVGRMIALVGIVRLLMVAVVVRGAGLIGIGLAPEWWLLVLAAFCFGIGSGVLDAGMNTYFAMNLSPRLMNWLHACFGLGAMIGPILMTSLLSSGAGWRAGYVIVGVVQASIVILLIVRAKDWQQQAPSGTVAADNPNIPHKRYLATLSRPIVWVNVALFFCYAGVEATAGNWSFTLFTEGRGASVAVAGFWVSFYWASFTFGRLFFGFIADRVNVLNTVRLMMVIALISTLFIWWNPVDWVSYAALATLGFAMAPVFPLMISSTPLRLGVADATNAIGVQVGAAALGIAVLPGLAGVLAQQMGIAVIAPYMVTAAIVMLVLQEIAVRGAKQAPAR